MQGFKIEVAKLLKRIKQEQGASAVPAGREADFPHLVFNEQFANALAQSMGLDIATMNALAKGGEDSKTSDPRFNILGGLENRI